MIIHRLKDLYYAPRWVLGLSLGCFEDIGIFYIWNDVLGFLVKGVA